MVYSVSECEDLDLRLASSVPLSSWVCPVCPLCYQGNTAPTPLYTAANVCCSGLLRTPRYTHPFRETYR